MELFSDDAMAWTDFLGDDFSLGDLTVEPEQGGEGFDREADANSLETCKPRTASVTSFEINDSSMELDFQTTECVAELEWVSRFVDDSFFEYPESKTNLRPATPAINLLLSTDRPFIVPVKPRSKRSRTTSTRQFNSTWFDNTSASSASSSSCGEQMKRRRGRKKRRERRCSHCGAEKTPQWRVGPTGAKTLCNACGVRFKSGRLLPEYRPASSPTFVGSVHSNSHRKVLEMRRMREEGEHPLL